MQLIVAINCSARKTAVPMSALRARSLPRGTPSDLAAGWRARCARAGGEIAARRLYAGRGFSLACEIARSSGSELRVISAGMGLLSPDSAIPPYSLSVSQQAQDCILHRAPRGLTFSAAEWWHVIRTRVRGVSPFAHLMAARPRSLLLIAATRPYLEMLVSELASLDEPAQNRIRILGPTHTQYLPEPLRHWAMPYDGRLDDVTKNLRGTAYDFPVRALAHFVNLVKLDRRIETAASHARRVRQSLAHWTAPSRPIRKRVDDSTLSRQIKILKVQSIARTAGLRHLRSELGFACEQSRFAKAWESS